MSTLIIKDARVVSPEDGLDGVMDIAVSGGVITSIGRDLFAGDAQVIDVRGQVASPGFIDLHAHLREPGGEASETLETGLAAAVAGGFTTICAMPNTQPVNDNPEQTRWLIARADEIGLARVFPIAAVSLGSLGEELTNFPALAAAGAVAFSDDGRPVKTKNLMRRALDQARALGQLVIDHCEDPVLTAGGVIHAGAAAEKLGVKGIPTASEEVCVERDLELAAAAAARLHLAHLSTTGAVEMVRNAKRNGVRVSCEVTPHHFALTDEAVLEYGTNAKMNPPLRSERDRTAMIEGLADGTVDAIATDHAPHAPELKARPITEAPFGVIGFETALSLAVTELAAPGVISLARLVELFSSQPARILNKPALGRLRPGGAADITLFDPQLEWTYRTANGKSKSRNSPFDGWKLKGAVTTTIVAGRVVYRRTEPAVHANR